MGITEGRHLAAAALQEHPSGRAIPEGAVRQRQGVRNAAVEHPRTEALVCRALLPDRHTPFDNLQPLGAFLRFRRRLQGGEMSNRERVQRAVEDPVEAAERELQELNAADVETRLTVLINGRGRGVAAGLEELAVAIDELSRILLEKEQTSRPASPLPEDAAREEDAPPPSGVPREEQPSAALGEEPEAPED